MLRCFLLSECRRLICAIFKQSLIFAALRIILLSASKTFIAYAANGAYVVSCV